MTLIVSLVAASSRQHMPLYVPMLLTAFGVVCWFAGGRRMLRDPRAEFRRIAEARARSRLRHPFGRGEVEVEFGRQWRLRWLVLVVIVIWCGGVIWFWILALTGA